MYKEKLQIKSSGTLQIYQFLLIISFEASSMVLKRFVEFF